MNYDVLTFLQEIDNARKIKLPQSVRSLQAIGKALLPLIPSSTESLMIEYCGNGDSGEIVSFSILPLRTISKGPTETWKYCYTGPNGEHKGDTYQPTQDVDHCDLPEVIRIMFEDQDQAVEFSAQELKNKIEDLAFEILYNRHPGWEISDGEADGGSGSLTMEFPSLKVSLDHSSRFFQSEEYSDEWGIDA